MTDFEDVSDAFACTSANCRAEVLEELMNETDRPMFFERVLNSTVRHDSDEGHFFATPQCGNLMRSSESPIFFLAAYALPIIRWTMRTMAWEEEHLRSRDRHRQAWNAIWDPRLSLMTWQKGNGQKRGGALGGSRAF